MQLKGRPPFFVWTWCHAIKIAYTALRSSKRVDCCCHVIPELRCWVALGRPVSQCSHPWLKLWGKNRNSTLIWLEIVCSSTSSSTFCFNARQRPPDRLKLFLEQRNNDVCSDYSYFCIMMIIICCNLLQKLTLAGLNHFNTSFFKLVSQLKFSEWKKSEIWKVLVINRLT